MSKTRRKRGGGERRPRDEPAEPAAGAPVRSLPAPPRPRRWLLVLASVLLAVWVVALAILAWQAAG